ncbi:MAG: molybdopterin dinucleotide binding domain-containing protein, partial [Acidobacteriota bacterium]
MRSFAEAFGAAGLWEYEPFETAPMRAANRICFGIEGVWRLRLERARTILSLGADFLETWLSPLEQARGYAEARRYHNGEMGRHVQLEPRLSLTGANADQWLPIRPGSEYALAMGLLHQILVEELDRDLPAPLREGLVEITKPFVAVRAAELTGVPADSILYLARAFARARPGVALPVGVSASGRTATAAHIAVNLLNLATGNLGVTLELVDSPSAAALATHAELGTLIERMAADELAILVLHDTNPSYTLPPSSGWAAAAAGVPLVVALSATLDETASEADLVLPLPTPLEAWGDWQPRAGVNGLQQPCTRPLHDSRHAGEIFLHLAEELGGEVADALPWQGFHDCLRDRWSKLMQEQAAGPSFEAFWSQALQSGGVWNEVEVKPLALDTSVLGGSWLPQLHPVTVAGREAEPSETGSPIFDLVVFPSLHHYDGRGANQPWLQEVADPVAQVAWGPWAEVQTDTAQRLGIDDGDLLVLRSAEGEVRIPARLSRWIHSDVVAVPIGHGHTAYGRTALQRSGNAVHLLSWEVEEISGGLLWLSEGISVERLGPRQQLVSPRGSARQEERGIAQAVALTTLRSAGGRKESEQRQLPPLYPAHQHPEHRWAMVIDNHACIGCNACAVACYAENNVPVVGREQMALGREMAWLQLEVYDEGTDSPDVRFLPMLCQQCDNAPCEPVCPVTATYHNPEGLNAQIYNRCVGTRYCSHNCPYKVRRFNWLQPQFPEPLNLQL